MNTEQAIPKQVLLYKPVEDFYGKRLALVFGNEFRGGECPFYKNQCEHCDIGAGERVQFTSEVNRKRLEFFKAHYQSFLPDVIHLLIYNSGNVLNPKEMSQETLGMILDYVSSLERCKIVSVDSREMYITVENLERLVSGIRSDQNARVVLGIESQDDNIRIGNLNKKMTKEAIEKAFGEASRYHGKFGVDINVVFQPPEIVGEAAIREAVATTKYGLSLGQRYGVPVDFNLNTYYPSIKSKLRFPNHPRANLEHALEALVRMKEIVNLGESSSMVYLGWHDEGHDQEQSIRAQEINRFQELVKRFNVMQDTAISRN